MNAEGIIETVTENIKDLIRYTRQDLQKQALYTFVHTGDHAKLSPTFGDMSFTVGWGDHEQDDIPAKRPLKTRIRMLVKPEGIETMDDKKREEYKDVVIFAAPFNKGKMDEIPYLS